MYLGKPRNGQAFYARYLGLGDIPAIMKLQKKVVKALLEQDALEPLSIEEFSYILKDEELMLGIFTADRLIAFRALLVPRNDDGGNLGIDIGLENGELKQIIYSEVSNVDPDFRGNGLQTYMGKILLGNIDGNRFRYILATVAPFNIASLKDKFSLGMEIVGLKEKYGGKLRYILKKDLTVKPTDRIRESYIQISMNDIEQQQEILKKGYLGVSIGKTEDGIYVRFER